RGGALQRLPRIRHWLRTWERLDPEFDHWHLGPAAVARTHQGQGIDTRLMAAVCERLDREQGVGYLETDKPENVRLYRRGGFEVVAERQVLGGDQLVHAPSPALEARPGRGAAGKQRGIGGKLRGRGAGVVG